MALELGYLLPTREHVMRGEHRTGGLMDLAVRAEALGFDSLWVGDSLVAKPRHEPLMVLAAVAAVTQRARLGTAVLLPGLRNPVLLAQQVATLDQLSEGRVILGLGIAADGAANRNEFEAAGVPFEKRVGRLLEGADLCRALWQGEPVDWDGRWTLRGATLGPEPFQAGGPPVWMAGTVPAARQRIARRFDGWFPTGPSDTGEWAEILGDIRARASALGRPADAITAAGYLTVCVDDNATRALEQIDAYLEHYYSVPGAVIRKRQACFGGPLEQVVEWLSGFASAGMQHACIRIVGDPRKTLPALAGARARIG